MVIVCPECSTKFRVNPERIPDAGAKVRCARCKLVFLAEKPAPLEEPIPVFTEPEAIPEEPAAETPGVTDAVETGSTTDTSEVPETFEIPQPAAEPTEKSFSAPEAEDGFSYDQFRDLDTSVPEEDDFTFGGEEDSAEEPFSEAASDETEDDFSFSGAEEETVAEEVAFSDEKVPEEPTVEETPARTTREEETEPKPPQPAPTEEKPGSTSSIIRILLLLILGLVLIGGALYVINGPEQLEQAIEQILGQQTSPAQSGQIALTNLEGKFINNQDAGELFVIRGNATNNFNQARASIQVKGVIFDQNGKPLLQKTIFCGNPINDQELQTLPFSKLEEMMRNQFGKSLDNMKVNSKEAIPFVIAFRDLPKNLSEFSVDVTSSEPVVK